MRELLAVPKIEDATRDMQQEHMLLSNMFRLGIRLLLEEKKPVTPKLRYCFESTSDETAWTYII